MVEMVWLLELPFSRFGRFKIHARYQFWVGAGCAVTVQSSQAVHMAASRVVSHATTLGRSSRLGLAEAILSEPLAPRPAA